MRQETRKPPREAGQGPGFALRLWLWLVPCVMLLVSLVLAGVAAASESWTLVAVMVLMAAFAAGLLALHYWVLYRFGRTE